MVATQIFCPINFSVASTHVLEQAAAIARHCKARILAMAVLPTLAPELSTVSAEVATVGGANDEDLGRWRHLAHEQCRAIADAGVGLRVEVVEGHPVEAILARATPLGADLSVRS